MNLEVARILARCLGSSAKEVVGAIALSLSIFVYLWNAQGYLGPLHRLKEVIPLLSDCFGQPNL